MPSALHFMRGLLGAIRVLGLGLVIHAALYPVQKAYHQARFGAGGHARSIWNALRHWRLALAQGARRPTPPPREQFSLLGGLRAWQVREQTIECICEGGTLWLTVLTPDLFRVRASPGREFRPLFSYAVDKGDEAWPACSFAVREEAAEVVIQTERMECRLMRAPCRVRFLDLSGNVISEDADGAGYAGEWNGCWRRLPADERIFGLGEKAFGLDQRGRRYEMWNSDPAGYGPGRDPLYMSFPMYLGLCQGRCYGLFFDNSYRSVFDIGQSEPSTLSFIAEGGELRYYLFYGPEPATVLARYTELTGRMPLPAIWALGYHQSRWSYYPEGRMRQIAAEFRAREIPCDALYFDIHYMDGYRNFTWDRRRFPNPAGLIAELAEQGFQSVALIDAGVKADHAYAACASGLQRHVFLKYPDGSLFRGPVWPGHCYFPDFTAPHARAWWAEQYAEFMRVGLAGAWNDMNEPVVMGPSSDCPPDAVRHDMEGIGGDHRAAHNVYGMQMARATRDALVQAQPARRPFVLTRAAFCGVQRYALGWTGDNESTWESLALSIPMILNLGLSGLAFVGPDVGGFIGDADGELLTRWTQLGAAMPFFRNHCALFARDQEPWAFGEPYTTICRRYIRLRYRLLPLLYTAFWQSAQSGAPVARPLFWSALGDPRAVSVEDQFTLGDHLLVAPIVQPARAERSVYLPAGEWFDWWDDRRLSGGARMEVHAPLEIMPLFIRAGAVLPLAEAETVRSSEDVWTRLPLMSLHIYVGSQKSELYEDAGEGWEYRLGQYRHTVFTTHWGGKSLRVTREVRGAFSPAYQKFRIVVHGLTDSPTGVYVDGAPATFDFGGKPAVVTLMAEDFHRLEICV